MAGRPTRAAKGDGMKEAAGTLLYRKRDGGWEVLIVHPSGNYNRRAPWSIPKGELDPDEDRETTARRETEEETGVRPGPLEPLGDIVYKSRRKRVWAFAGPAPEDAEPRCASWEVDRAEFVPLDEAEKLLHPDQRVFIQRLKELLARRTCGSCGTETDSTDERR